MKKSREVGENTAVHNYFSVDYDHFWRRNCYRNGRCKPKGHDVYVISNSPLHLTQYTQTPLYSRPVQPVLFLTTMPVFRESLRISAAKRKAMLDLNFESLALDDYECSDDGEFEIIPKPEATGASDSATATATRESKNATLIRYKVEVVKVSTSANSFEYHNSLLTNYRFALRSALVLLPSRRRPALPRTSL
jgi:hypothetical protein